MTDGQMRNYVVVRSFHLGQANLNLSAGDKLRFDGEEMFLERTRKSYSADTLRFAITARHVVEDDGSVDFKKPEAVERPKPNVIVHDHEDMVVARVNLPDKVAGRNRKATEDVAKTTHANTPPRVVVDDQRVVGSATKRRTLTAGQAAMVSDDEAARVAAEQGEEARVVSTGEQARRNKVAELMASEGFGTEVKGSGLPIAAGDDGKVVGKIKSADERQRELRENARASRASAGESSEMTPEERAAFEKDLELARAKREGRAPAGVPQTPEESGEILTKRGEANKKAAAEGPRLMLADDGHPLGYPVSDHWRRRLQWCKDHENNVDALMIVYRRATESFQSRLRKEFPDIDWE